MDGAPYINYPGKIATTLYDIIKAQPDAFLIAWKISGVMLGALLCFIAFSNFRKTLEVSTSKFYQSSTFYIVIAIAGIILLRLPNLVLREQTSDENFWVANTAKFLTGAVLWKNVSGATGGPLVYAPVSIMYYLFGGINYATLRLFGLIFCIIPTLLFVFLTFVRLFNKAAAMVLVLPLVMFFSFQYSNEMIGYNSEHMAMVLIAFSLWLLSGLKKAGIGKILLLGVVLGLTPYAKLQSMPVTLVIILCVLVEIFFFIDKPMKQKLYSFFSFAIGGIIPTLLLLLYLVLNNAVPYFWNGYIIDNLLYTKNFTVHYKKSEAPAVIANPPATNIHTPSNVSATPEVKEGKITLLYELVQKNGSEITILLLSLIILIIIGYIIIRRNKIKINMDDRRGIIYFLLACVGSIVAVITPHTHFVHYLFITVVPVVLLAGLVAGLTFPFSFESATLKRVLGVYFIIIVAAPLALMWSKGNKGMEFVKYKASYRVDSISRVIKHYSHPNESLALWGAQTEFYVETELVPATKGLPLFNEMFSPEKADYYMEDYMNDIKYSKPVIFLDDIASNSFLYDDTTKYRHEKFPMLNALISKDYTFVKRVEEDRIYVLNTRLEEMGLKPKQ